MQDAFLCFLGGHSPAAGWGGTWLTSLACLESVKHSPARGGGTWLALLACLKSVSRLAISWFHQSS